MKLYPDDWRVRLTSGAVVAACMAVVMIFGPMVGINGFWPYMLSITAAAFIGSALGRLLCRRLFGTLPGGSPPDHLPRA